MKSLTAVWKSWHSLPLFSPTHTYIVFCFLCVLWVWQKLYGYVHKEMPSIKRDYGIWYYVLSHCIMYALWISPWWNVILMSSLVFKLVGYMLLLIFFFLVQWFIFTWIRKQNKQTKKNLINYESSICDTCLAFSVLIEQTSAFKSMLVFYQPSVIPFITQSFCAHMFF